MNISKLIGIFFSGCVLIYGQDNTAWSHFMTKGGASCLKGSTVASTPNGSRSGQILLSKSSGSPSTYTITFSIDSVSSIKDFEFDDFEGPDSSVSGTPMLISTRSAYGELRLRVNPAGSYVPDPKDGFEFSCSRRGKKNAIIDLIRKTSKNGGKIIVNIVDSKNPSKSINAEFAVGEWKSLFEKLL